MANNGEFNQNELANLENLRKSVASKILKIKIFCVVLGVVFGFLILKSSGDLGIGICLGAMVGILIYRLLSYSLLRGFSNEFKEKIITQIIKEISPNLAYDKAKFIEFNEFDRPRIYNTVIDIYQGNDLIWGNIDGVELKFSDIYLARVDTKNKERSIQVQTPLFYGIAFIADFSKFFTAKVIVLDKKGSFTSTNLRKTKMDNSEFNDTFVTFCDDEIAARYILTPNLMEKMLYLRKFFGAECDFCFVENKIYIYINLGKDSFEADYKVPLIGENSAPLRLKKEIMQFIDIVENLKLNSKIFKPNFSTSDTTTNGVNSQNSQAKQGE